MGKKIKEIRIIKKDYNNTDYTFVSDSIVSNVNATKNDTDISMNIETKTDKKPDERIIKKSHSKKSNHKGRKISDKSMQGHSPIYE